MEEKKFGGFHILFQSFLPKISKVQAQDISVQVAKLLPNNFYVYVPPIESKEKDKDKPALVMSNSKVYPFIYVEP